MGAFESSSLMSLVATVTSDISCHNILSSAVIIMLLSEMMGESQRIFWCIRLWHLLFLGQSLADRCIIIRVGTKQIIDLRI